MPDDVVDPSPIAGPDALTQTDIISRRAFLILWRVPQDSLTHFTLNGHSRAPLVTAA